MQPYAPPSAPLSVQATGGVGQATVSWQAPSSDGGSGIGGYAVTPIQDGVPLAPVPTAGAGTSTVITNLTGHSYTFTVRAVTGGGAGPPSQPSNVVMVKSVPRAPAGVTAKGGDAQALVSWTAPADDGGLPITGYDVAVTGNGVPWTVHVYGSMSTVVRGLTNFSLYTFNVSAVNAAGVGPPAASNQVMPQLTVVGGNYRRVPVASRILDTRLSGNRMGPGTTLNLPVLGRGGIPGAGVSAVVLNVTATGGTRDGYLSIYPSFGVQSTASTLNWRTGQTVANLTVVQVSRSGSVTIFNAAGWVDTVVDIDGYFGTPLNSTSDDGLFQAEILPQRLLDTRSTPSAWSPDAHLLKVQIPTSIYGGTTIAAVLNLAATGASAPTYLTAWPDGETMPGTSNLNLAPGRTVANRGIVPVGQDGMVDVYTAAGRVDVIADLNGWFVKGSGAGTRYTAIFPRRIFDSRTDGGQLTPDVVLAVPVPPPATAIVLNVTVTNPSAPSYLTVFPDPGPGTSPPVETSDINYTAGQTVANLVVVGVGYSGLVDLYNVVGSADVVIDVVGYFGPVYMGVPATPPPPTYRPRR
ncbi:MAG: fibronectin type III domain-containing protein [Chloroflexi bacterium]|nr:MAG: fibronectin type III domain-containing protein [Chloroflexota bacterium]